MKTIDHYHLHGWRIAVEAASAEWAAAVHEILGAYRTEPSAEADLRLRLGAERLAPPAERPVRGRFEDLVFHGATGGDELWIDVHGRGWVQVDPSGGRARAGLDLDPVEDGWVVAHHAFYPALLELLKVRGLFPIHAGLVARRDEGLLICGASGSGKTTLCLALAARGWSLLADDTCFLSDGEEEIVARAFWEDLHVTEETVRRFPSLGFLRDQAPRRANWKKHFGVDQLEGLRLAESCRPRWILFPRVGGEGSSAVEDLRRAEAVMRLTPQSVVPAQPSLVGLHMGILADVARQSRAMSLTMGPDLDEVAATLEAALAGEGP